MVLWGASSSTNFASIPAIVYQNDKLDLAVVLVVHVGDERVRQHGVFLYRDKNDVLDHQGVDMVYPSDKAVFQDM